jgi:excisionase family DNA binding protein
MDVYSLSRRITMQVQEQSTGRWLTVADIVDELQVHEATVRRWIKTGELDATELGNRAGYRIRQEDFDRFLDERSTKKVAA